jgi:hypothetical protein
VELSNVAPKFETLQVSAMQQGRTVGALLYAMKRPPRARIRSLYFLAASQKPVEEWLKNNVTLTISSWTHKERLEMLISGSSFSAVSFRHAGEITAADLASWA